MDDVGAHVQGFDGVEVVEVIFQVELVHPDGGEEAGVVCGLMGGRADESQDEVGSAREGDNASVIVLYVVSLPG